MSSYKCNIFHPTSACGDHFCGIYKCFFKVKEIFCYRFITEWLPKYFGTLIKIGFIDYTYCNETFGNQAHQSQWYLKLFSFSFISKGIYTQNCKNKYINVQKMIKDLISFGKLETIRILYTGLQIGVAWCLKEPFLFSLHYLYDKKKKYTK